MKDKLNKINEGTFIVSDTHFGHKNIMQFEPCRLTAMNIDGHVNHERWIIENWNAQVQDGEDVLVLGDFAFRARENNEDIIKLFDKYKHLTKNEFETFLKDKLFDDL